MGLEEVRDIAIVVLAIFNIVWLVALLVLAVAFYRKVFPVLASLHATVSNVQATTAFVAETTVHPIIRVLSFVAGLRAAAGAFRGKR